MKNIFSESELSPQVDPAFAQQAPPGYFNAPATAAELPAPLRVEVDPIVERNSQRAGERVQWRNTRIGGWGAGSLVNEAERVFQPDWWKSAQPRDAYGQVFQLLDRAERAVAARDGREQEGPDNDRGISARVIAERQRDREESVDSLSPTDDESISDWFGRIAKNIDANGNRKALWDTLRAYASRFAGSAKAKRLDTKLVRQFLQTALN